MRIGGTTVGVGNCVGTGVGSGVRVGNGVRLGCGVRVGVGGTAVRTTVAGGGVGTEAEALHPKKISSTSAMPQKIWPLRTSRDFISKRFLKIILSLRQLLLLLQGNILCRFRPNA